MLKQSEWPHLRDVALQLPWASKTIKTEYVVWKKKPCVCRQHRCVCNKPLFTCPSGFSSNQQWKSGDVAIQDDRWPLVTPAKPRPEKPPAVRRQHGTPKPFWEQIHGEAEGVWCIIGETCQQISLVTLKNVKGLHSLSSHIPHLQYLLQQPCHAMPQLPEIARVLK